MEKNNSDTSELRWRKTGRIWVLSSFVCSHATHAISELKKPTRASKQNVLELATLQYIKEFFN